jgi:endonuclease III
MAKKKMAGVAERVAVVLPVLEKMYPDAKCALNHANAFELLVATILSAQCTDVRVNMVTPVLFKKYPTPAALAKALQEEVEEVIKSTGFFRNKAKALREASGDIVERFGGKVPATMEGLTSLRGVGRKTANVVLGNAFGENVGVVVDTHVGRLAGRLGWTKETVPEKVEADLMKLVPREQWTMVAHWLIFHGRRVCGARGPKCGECGVREWCPRVGVGK